MARPSAGRVEDPGPVKALRRLLKEQGLPVPPEGRAPQSICRWGLRP